MWAMVVVIGAGHNGLVAAVRLAARGLPVTVLEVAPTPGGGVRSTGSEIVFDECAAFFPLTAASPAFRALDLEIDWVNPPVCMAHVFDDGSALPLYRDVSRTSASVGEAWGSLVERLWPLQDKLVHAALDPLPPVRAVLGLGKEAVLLAPFALSPSARLGRRLFGDDRAAAWLAGSGAHADVSPFTLGSGAFSLGLNFLGHLVGWPFPRGGAGRITDALVERLRSHGGELRCGAAVERIEGVSGGRVRGVVLRGGERLGTDTVLFTASPAVLLSLLPAGALPGRLGRWRYGLGTLKLDYELSAPVPWPSPDAREAGVVHAGGPLSEIAASLDQAKAGIFPEHPALVVGQQSLHDPTRAPEGRHTLYVYARVPRATTADMADGVDAQIERYAPGFRDTVIARHVRTPADIERENPSMVGGDLASGSFEPDQQLIFRPDPRLCRHRTPVRGLYVAGAWVHPGAGVHGMSGWNAARMILRDASRRTWST
jgi:phytoene dehydrogenase-like protein